MLVDFTVIDASRAPRPGGPKSRFADQMATFDSYVASLKKGQVGRLLPEEGETARGLAMRVRRAGARLNKPLETWILDGASYFKLRS